MYHSRKISIRLTRQEYEFVLNAARQHKTYAGKEWKLSRWVRHALIWAAQVETDVEKCKAGKAARQRQLQTSDKKYLSEVEQSSKKKGV